MFCRRNGVHCWSQITLSLCVGLSVDQPIVFNDVQGVHTFLGYLDKFWIDWYINQYYTSTKAIIIFVMSDENVSPYYEKGLKRGPFNVFNSNPYPVAYHWTALLARKIMMLRRGFYDIPLKNVGQSNVTSCLALL